MNGRSRRRQAKQAAKKPNKSKEKGGTRTSAIVFNVARHFLQSVTPESLFVVAPAGYNLKATIPASRACITSSGGVLSVRYKVINGTNEVCFALLLDSRACWILPLYAKAYHYFKKIFL